MNRGVFMTPGREEEWTLSVTHTVDGLRPVRAGVRRDGARPDLLIDALRRPSTTRFDDLCELTALLVRERTVLGDEEGAIAVVHERLSGSASRSNGSRIDAAAALADPHGGYPALPYAGRRTWPDGCAAPSGAAVLHLSGHVDVVPVDGVDRWTRDPWGAEVADGRMWGRGAGDMKSGIAAYLIAVEAFLDGVRAARRRPVASRP